MVERAAVLSEKLGEMTFDSLAGIRLGKLMRNDDDNGSHSIIQNTKFEIRNPKQIPNPKLENRSRN
jgi:hypothetical protein